MLPSIKNPDNLYNKNIISQAGTKTEPTLKRFQLRKA
jgi:hypothetical protein